MVAEGRTPKPVEISAGQYLLEALFEAGPSKPGAMGGELPLEWLDVWAYMQATQAVSEPWEARALVQMSSAYVYEKAAGASVFSIEPRLRV